MGVLDQISSVGRESEINQRTENKLEGDRPHLQEYLQWPQITH